MICLSWQQTKHQKERNQVFIAIFKPDRLLAAKFGILTGVELRYIRSAGMGLSQPALGKLMGIDGQSIARWEKSGKVPRWADKLVRLLYAAHAQGNEPICRVMERIKTVERIVKQRIVAQEDRGHWTPSVEESSEGAAA
jgi:DNA-binding transcriptional regulator YiaG